MELGKKVEPKKYLALVLTDEVVQAAVWSLTDSKVEILSLGTPVEWDGDTATTTELVTAVDATISGALEGLSIDPNEVILGIPESWIDKDGVLGVKQAFIKNIIKELDLKAIGYVSLINSVINYLKTQEGAPTTSIIIQVTKLELTLALVKLGRIEAVNTISRGDDILENVVEGISAFHSDDNLPSRIILFNSMHPLQEIVQDLLSYEWNDEFNFLHTPKIEALPKDVAIHSLVAAGGTELQKLEGISTPEVEVEVMPPKEQPLLSAEEIGFTTPRHDSPVIVSNISVPKLSLPRLALPKLSFSLPHIDFRAINSTAIFALIGVVTIFALTFWLIWFLPHATLDIKVIPKSLNQNIEIALSSSDATINYSEKIIPATIESLSETGEKTIETTGKKLIGENAKGEVVIYNRTSSAKTFQKGTVISFGKLKYSLNDDIQVSAKTANSDYVDVPGKATIAITALSIGSDSNLPANTEFTIANFAKDSYVAKNETALVGGTSQEAQVVSKEDQKNISALLKQDLLAKIEANTTLNDITTNSYLIPDSSTIDSIAYSTNVGEVARSLTATMTLKVTLLNYKIDDVVSLANSTLDSQIPLGYVRSNIPSKVTLTASSAKGNVSRIDGTAYVEVLLLPTIDKQKLSSQINGLKLPDASSLISKQLTDFQSIGVSFTPKFLSRFGKLPKNPKNIKLNVISI